MGIIDRANKAFSFKDACMGVDMNPMEEAVWRSRQSLAARLGISVSDVLFYLSGRNLTRQNTRALSVRRQSDSKTSVIPFRPPVAYDAPRNMLHYDPTTWAEWTFSNGATANSNGMVLTKTSGDPKGAISGNFKPSTKYGFLYYVVASTIATYIYNDSIAFAPSTAWGKSVGNQKLTLTSKATITDFRTNFSIDEAGASITLRDIRVFELPTGSQIESDFTNLSADELNAKYPMVGANGAPVGAAPGVAKDRVCNAFANGDGRYGTVGWNTLGGVTSPVAKGIRSTGTGSLTYILSEFNRGAYIFPSSATRRYFVKVKINRPVSSTLKIASHNGTSYCNVDVSAQVPSGTSGWAKAILTQTDLGASAALEMYVHVAFPDAATQNGKNIDVEYATIVPMGDSAADPHYNDDAATFDAYLRTQPGVVTTPDGEYYIPPYGLCPGEQDLDVTAAFGGTSQLYATTAYEQGPAVDATQATAASQTKVWDNGLSYPGLGLFDGSDDYMVADLPDITTGPATWWARFSANSQNGYLFCRNGSTSSDMQYACAWLSSNESMNVYLNSGSAMASITVPANVDTIVAFVWDGATVTPYKKINGVVTAGTPAAFTGTLTTRANKFIGCRSNAADGSARSLFFKGTQYEIGITKTALTPAQIAKL